MSDIRISLVGISITIVGALFLAASQETALLAGIFSTLVTILLKLDEIAKSRW